MHRMGWGADLAAPLLRIPRAILLCERRAREQRERVLFQVVPKLLQGEREGVSE